MAFNAPVYATKESESVTDVPHHFHVVPLDLRKQNLSQVSVDATQLHKTVANAPHHSAVATKQNKSSSEVSADRRMVTEVPTKLQESDANVQERHDSGVNNNVVFIMDDPENNDAGISYVLLSPHESNELRSGESNTETTTTEVLSTTVSGSQNSY